MAVRDLPKVKARVRFPYPAPRFHFRIFHRAFGGRGSAPAREGISYIYKHTLLCIL